MGLGEAAGAGRVVLRQALRSAPWALGVGIGVALGGWLTAVSGSGAPGAASLDVTRDVLVVPGLSVLAVLVSLTFGGVLVELVRRHAGASGPDDDDHDKDVQGEGQQV